jgi:hypothetical protein
MFFAHIGGVPVEEALMPLVSGAYAALALARARLGSRLWRGRRESPVPFFGASDGFPAFGGSLSVERQCRRRTTRKAEAR